MSETYSYRIGTPGKKWGALEKAEWLRTRTYSRSYKDEVISKLNFDGFDVTQYGELKVDNTGEKDQLSYPLFAIKSKDWNESKPSLLVTGGVHGYEKSGVQGAILFCQKKALEYSKIFNIVVAPCVSPWGYETIERWNSKAVDPNRSFNPDGEIVEGRSFNPEPGTDESKALIGYLDTLGIKEWVCHLDLHETTDTDKTEFRPAKLARDGETNDAVESIPDGFYLVSDMTNPNEAFCKAMIDSVKKVTHIAPAEEDGTIIGEKVVQEGVIAIPSPRSLGLCAGVTNAPFAVTTEVYPDSEKATDEECNEAQVACIDGALQFIIKDRGLVSAS